MALGLCARARQLCSNKRCDEAIKICSFVSTLCETSDLPECLREASLCGKKAESCILRTDRACEVAEELCNEAKRICPHNFKTRGS
jgi:hypothetical protein